MRNHPFSVMESSLLLSRSAPESNSQPGARFQDAATPSKQDIICLEARAETMCLLAR